MFIVVSITLPNPSLAVGYIVLFVITPFVGVKSGRIVPVLGLKAQAIKKAYA